MCYMCFVCSMYLMSSMCSMRSMRFMRSNNPRGDWFEMTHFPREELPSFSFLHLPVFNFEIRKSKINQRWEWPWPWPWPWVRDGAHDLAAVRCVYARLHMSPWASTHVYTTLIHTCEKIAQFLYFSKNSPSLWLYNGYSLCNLALPVK